MTELLGADVESTTAINAEPRSAERRRRYLDVALACIPRILASVDRNSFGPTYGCCDRQFWHYRTAAFPSEMYQEAALPLALAYARRLPGNQWYGEVRLAEAAVAAMRYSARTAHADGSCDDYYPFERALGAAVFSLQAQTEAYRLLGLDDPDLLRFFQRRAQWIAKHGESGKLTNHHALAALALRRTWWLTGDESLRTAARNRLEQVIAWQSPEGWFDEYGGADLGYQTVTIDCLAKLRGETGLAFLDAVLERAVSFARCFACADGTWGGEFGSRGSRHFYPHGFELLAGSNADAADLADDYLRSLETGAAARFEDDRMFIHPVASLIEAYCDWSPMRSRRTEDVASTSTNYSFPLAGLHVCRDAGTQAIVSTARGGTFHWHRQIEKLSVTHVDAGLIVETEGGRIAVSQVHEANQSAELARPSGRAAFDTTVSRSLQWVRFRRATPAKQAAFHVGMNLVGRFARDLVRRLLQRKVIAGGGAAPIRLTRNLRIAKSLRLGDVAKLTVTDIVELTDPKVRVKRLAFASDLQAAYTAASEAYHPGLLQPWTDLDHYAAELNEKRCVVIVREL